MSSPQPPQAECKWCGEKLTEGAEQCPFCKRPVAGELRPIGDGVGIEPRAGVSAPSRPAPPPPPRWERPREQESVTPAPGQEEFGSWANIQHIMRVDRVFGALLILLAAGVVFNLLRQDWLGLFVGGAILWGIVTFRWWGYWLAIIGASLGVLMGLVGVIAVLATAGAAAVFLLIPLAINGFVVMVLYTRRDRFG